ncbi:hypothetical protein [Rubellicoccus peritrichatus]|uniref:Uncharacterized protein n=1 Tax=Rubellicoccus peritrichatus TaxID=3080537 RepID=A0AAQ3QR13_9BACT|nr:hypothetical protein [Puniceicoccus sp. CR14]WOO40838.1 hypothetical protein RZN69_19615 [Puniceicoccus sp. CR14]
MKLHEKVELLLIPCVVALVYGANSVLPGSLQLGWACALAALILLFQGFIRDLYLLYLQKTMEKNNPKRRMKCMCLESTLGMLGILAGIILALFLPDVEFPINRWGWTGFVSSMMLFGFLGKDLVVFWKPFAIRRDPDHANIIFSIK